MPTFDRTRSFEVSFFHLPPNTLNFSFSWLKQYLNQTEYSPRKLPSPLVTISLNYPYSNTLLKANYSSLILSLCPLLTDHMHSSLMPDLLLRPFSHRFINLLPVLFRGKIYTFFQTILFNLDLLTEKCNDL